MNALTRRLWQGFACCAVFLALCAAQNGHAADTATAPTTRFTQIVCSDSGGFTGRGTGKWLSIDGNGTIQLKNRKGAVVNGQLNEKELADLARDVAAVDWSRVQKRYPASGADMIQNDLVVTFGNKTQETHAEVKFAKIPPALKTLVSRLDALHRQFASAGK